jgi:hypothetical protein
VPALASPDVTAAQPFAEALLALLEEEDVYMTTTGRPAWATFHRELEGVSYRELRAVVAGERTPGDRLIEECARVLRVRPEHFAEYGGRSLLAA